MVDNQEEKIKDLIYSKGYNIDEAIEKLGVSKQTYYNNVRREPLKGKFVDLVKEKLDLDLSILRSEEATNDDLRSVKEALGDAQSKLYIEQEKNKALRAEIERLRKEIIELQNTRNTG